MLFKARSVQQVAVLPFVEMAADVRILLVTTRDRGDWILPKGWPMSGLSLAAAAAFEAIEEAGVIGAIDDTPIGTYSYRKRMDAGYTVPCHVFVYPMLVREHRLDWPEQDERRVRWCSLKKAADLTQEAELTAFLEDLRADGFDRFAPLTAKLTDAPNASTPVDESGRAAA